MKHWKRLISIGLAIVLVLSMSACTGNKTTSEVADDGTTVGDTTDNNSTNTVAPSAEKRIINIGTWYDHYYDSDNTDIYENPYVSNEETAQMQLDAVRAVEERYNVEIHWVNLTYQGTQESINTSILAGSPDCDIYEVDVNFGIPAAVNGFAEDMRTVLPADSDLFTDQMAMRVYSIGSMEEAYLFKPVSAETTVESTYPLAFNLQMIEDANLTDPRILYENGEWTWDVFRDYMIQLTKDTDGDSIKDVYGFGSDINNLLNGLMMSNGTGIAMDTEENLTSSEVGECLDFMYNMYNVDNCAYPWYAEDFDTNRLWYKDGLVAFWVSAAWIMDANKDGDLGIETTFVPWPVGPSGDKDTNNMKNVAAGNAYMIPAGVDNPELVYAVFYDLMNWYQGDTELRDGDMSWWENSVITEENYEVMELMGSKENFDLWNVFLTASEMDLVGLVTGTLTPSQVQETYKQPYQDLLDTFYKK